MISVWQSAEYSCPKIKEAKENLKENLKEKQKENLKRERNLKKREKPKRKNQNGRPHAAKSFADNLQRASVV